MSSNLKCEANLKNGKCGKVATWEVKYDFGIRFLCDKHRNKTDKSGYSQGSKKINTMTLFEKLKDIIGLGWEVKFSSFAFQFEITVERETVDGKRFKRQSSLPLQDHFYEARIIDCIDWSIAEIEKDSSIEA